MGGRTTRRRVTQGWVALSVLASACGQIDEIREVFDTTPENIEDAVAAGPTTLPIIALTTRLPKPQSQVVDDHLVYVLDPDLVEIAEVDDEPAGDDPTADRSAGEGAPFPTIEPGLDAIGPNGDADIDTTPGPLTHVRVQMEATANIREIERARSTLEAYVASGAAVGEFTEDDLR
ncbi:MAG: hypothetical protein P8N02_16575, partial [Actinomycetota bacterium]|nr:hypothetical protein [Actinomycetota bacterium]